MPNSPPLNSASPWEEEDEFNLLTAVLEIATESADSYNPSINLFDRIAKAMKKRLSHEEILNKVRDLQQRYCDRLAAETDRIFTISDQIWGRDPKNGEFDVDGRNARGKRRREETTELESVYLVKNRTKRVEQEAERKCLHCQTTETPQFRNGPMGPKTLCNACGIRYVKGQLVPEYRPIVSPTFVESKHSNSHKKVLEMRRTRSYSRALRG